VRPRAGRREAILDVAAALVADRAAEGFRLDEVATGAGVGKATLFRWFPNRSALLSALESERGVVPVPDRPGRRDQVISVAMRLIGMQGVRSTTMEQVARAAGISTPALYWHFDNKHALAAAVIRAASPRPEAERFFREVTTGELREDLTALVHLIMGIAPRILLVQRIANDHRDEDDPLRDIALTEVAMPVWALLNAYFEEHVTRGNLSPALGMPRVLAFAGMMFSAIFARVTFGTRVVDDFSTFVDAFVTVFLEGAATSAYRNELSKRKSHTSQKPTGSAL
jgi:AcrR family transcriptional regulator